MRRLSPLRFWPSRAATVASGSSEREVAPFAGEADGPAAAIVEEAEAVRARLLQFTPCEFEHFVRLLLEKSGFVRVSVTRASGRRRHRPQRVRGGSE